jgi:hypothetical protein
LILIFADYRVPHYLKVEVVALEITKNGGDQRGGEVSLAPASPDSRPLQRVSRLRDHRESFWTNHLRSQGSGHVFCSYKECFNDNLCFKHAGFGLKS